MRLSHHPRSPSASSVVLLDVLQRLATQAAGYLYLKQFLQCLVVLKSLMCFLAPDYAIGIPQSRLNADKLPQDASVVLPQ